MRRLLTAVLVLSLIGPWLPAAWAADAPPPPFTDDAPPYTPDAIPRSQYNPTDEGNITRPIMPAETKKDYFVAIYSGSTLGVYFYVASAICRALEKSVSKHRIHCVPLRSLGVASNVSLMQQGRAQFIIVQSDTNYDASVGKIKLPSGRSVMSLHNELGVMAVQRGSDIHKPADLRGKRVNLGSEGTASRGLWLEFLKAQGLGIDDLGRAFAVTQEYNVMGLCSDYIDAFGLWIGHPAAALGGAIEHCGAHLVGMWSPGSEKLVEERKFYFRGEIPADTYPGQNDPIVSYGFKASLVADSRANPHIVYWLTRSVIENIDIFRNAHPALAAVKPREMFEKGNFLPFHPGADRYWRDIGWLGEKSLN